ncbi:MAG TPA: hypothetical protein VLV76_08405 [Candidatus Acidoferrum sp.]|nr:hypothetical protein [Candidatus Acidoferrum sp.]
MSATSNARRALRWTTLAGLLAATVALGATPAAADGWDNDWNHRHHRHNDRGYYHGHGYGYGYGGYGYRPRYYYYQPAPTYYYPPPPPAYYYPQPYGYGPSFSFGLTVPIH